MLQTLASRHPGDYSRADAAARVASATETAFNALHDELVSALMTNPAAPVATPGFGPHRRKPMSAAAVVEDMLAGSEGDALLTELLTIVGQCASGRPTPEAHLRAKAWIARVAEKHAKYHCDDAVEA